jgi:O-antigen ligase
MIPQSLSVRVPKMTVDRRVWWMIALIGFFAMLVMREISLPPMVAGVFGGLSLLGLFIIGLQHPTISLFVLVAYLPFSRLIIGNLGINMIAFNLTNILMGWVFVAAVLGSTARRTAPTAPIALNKLIVLFCVLGALSLIQAGETYGSWFLWANLAPFKRWLTPILLYFLTLWIVRDLRAVKTIVVIIMAAVVVAALMAIRELLLTGQRAGGIAEQPNILGAFFIYYMFLFAGLWLTHLRRAKAWGMLLPLWLCAKGISATASRGAFLAFPAAWLGLTLLRNKLLALISAILLFIVTVNPWLLPEDIERRMRRTFIDPEEVHLVNAEGVATNLEPSAANRLIIWTGAAQMIAEHPFGVGFGAFPERIGQYAPAVANRDAHNAYLLLAAEMGIPALLLFLWIVVAMLWKTRWLYRHTRDPMIKGIALGWFGGLCGLVVANLFGGRLHSSEIAGYFWIMCALIMRAIALERAAQQGVG